MPGVLSPLLGLSIQETVQTGGIQKRAARMMSGPGHLTQGEAERDGTVYPVEGQWGILSLCINF